MNLFQDGSVSWQWLVQKLCFSGEKWQSLWIYQTLSFSSCFQEGDIIMCLILLFSMWTIHHSVVPPEVVNIKFWTGWQDICFSLSITCSYLKTWVFFSGYKILTFIRKDNIQVFICRISSNCIVEECFSYWEHLLDLEDNKHWFSYVACIHQNRLNQCLEDKVYLAHGLTFLFIISNEKFCNFSALCYLWTGCTTVILI